jgi:hypothetical protein
MQYIIKKIHFNSFNERMILETEVNKENFWFESSVELPMEALNRLINTFQQNFSMYNFYDRLESECVSEDFYYTAKFETLQWTLEGSLIEEFKVNTPRKICA